MAMLSVDNIVILGLMILAPVAAVGATAGIVAGLVPRLRDGPAARLCPLAWVSLVAGGLAVLAIRTHVSHWLARVTHVHVSVPSVVAHSVWPVSIVTLAVLGLAGIAAIMAGFASGGRARHMRAVGVAAVLAPIVLFGPTYGPEYYVKVSGNWWAGRAPDTPHGRIVRIDMRLDFELAGWNPEGEDAPSTISLATWDDPELVQELVALVPWPDTGPGYGFKCQDGSPFALVFVTASGDERVVILACDSCATSGPAWDRGIGWRTPRLLTRVGELLVDEPAAQEYAAQFDEDVRRYRANWLYWADDPYHVHDALEAAAQ